MFSEVLGEGLSEEISFELKREWTKKKRLCKLWDLSLGSSILS